MCLYTAYAFASTDEKSIFRQYRVHRHTKAVILPAVPGGITSPPRPPPQKKKKGSKTAHKINTCIPRVMNLAYNCGAIVLFLHFTGSRQAATILISHDTSSPAYGYMYERLLHRLLTENRRIGTSYIEPGASDVHT